MFGGESLKNKIQWGILGAGNISRVFANSIIESQTSEVNAISSRELFRAGAFSKEFKIPKYYSDYDLLLSDPEIQAVYIALPHSFHAEWAIKAIRSKKHVLCEKPIAINFNQALSIAKEANENDVFLMEAFVFRSHPQTLRLINLLKNRVIGEVRFIDAAFHFDCTESQGDRHLLKSLGAGSILDAGCYPVSMSRLIAGEVLGTNLAYPDELVGVSIIDEAGIDLRSLCSMKFPKGLLAQISCGISLPKSNYLKIYGELGSIYVGSPWVPGGRSATKTKIILNKNTAQNPEIIFLENEKNPCNYMVDEFVSLLADKGKWDFYTNEALVNMKTLDAWRKSSQVSYDCDILSPIKA